MEIMFDSPIFSHGEITTKNHHFFFLLRNRSFQALKISQSLGDESSQVPRVLSVFVRNFHGFFFMGKIVGVSGEERDKHGIRVGDISMGIFMFFFVFFR